MRRLVLPDALLMEVAGESCSAFLMSRLWVTRFSSRSAHGRRWMGSGGRGVSICPATWRHRCQPVPDSQRDHLAHRSPQERRGSALVRRKLECQLRCDGGCCGCLLAPMELAAIDPHAVQDHRQLAGDCNTGTCHTPAFGNVHAPGAQRRPFGAADQQRVGCLIECGTGQFVTASADAALYVGLAGLVAPRRQAEMGADIARLSKATRLV